MLKPYLAAAHHLTYLMRQADKYDSVGEKGLTANVALGVASRAYSNAFGPDVSRRIYGIVCMTRRKK